ncbi:hypothetical protein Ahy_A10g050472 [Arachis hypogaea]|uniref:Endonuclease/exonuclease/phosphatase domain-containing protein n=1 Tax=Arachis hypogaea TaxID=3818 RepID=A0A445B9H1_ARAHY|nr:hypothetical protein Ahy_A10g050472 [Arachis hypogaea]
MITLIWNVRGAASETFRRIFKEMMRQHRPDIAILLKTKCSGDTAKRVIHNLGFSYSILEEAQGFVGGIWICWNRPYINITTIEKHSQYLHVKIQTQSEKEWFLTTVYASHQSQNRRELWPKILNIANQTMGDWLIAKTAFVYSIAFTNN